MTSWQPIETAPRDGTRVLTAWRGVDVKVNEFNSHRGKDRGYILGAEAWWYSAPNKQPTHWMPIPEPPND